MKIKRMYYKGVENKKQCNMCKKYFTKIKEVEICLKGHKTRHITLCQDCYNELLEFVQGNNMKAEKYREILAFYLDKETKKARIILDSLNKKEIENDYKTCCCELEKKIQS